MFNNIFFSKILSFMR